MEETKNYIRELIKRSDYGITSSAGIHADHAVFLGTPTRSPVDSSKLVLIETPFAELGMIYEFPIKSIMHIEEMESIVSDDGRMALKVKVWVKKGSIATATRPFIV